MGLAEGCEAMKLRPAVKMFAEAMEKELREHDSIKGEEGWKVDNRHSRRDRIIYLFGRLTDEYWELRQEITCHQHDRDRIRLEAVDVANFAMMIYDLEMKP